MFEVYSLYCHLFSSQIARVTRKPHSIQRTIFTCTAQVIVPVSTFGNRSYGAYQWESSGSEETDSIIRSWNFLKIEEDVQNSMVRHIQICHPHNPPPRPFKHIDLLLFVSNIYTLLHGTMVCLKHDRRVICYRSYPWNLLTHSRYPHHMVSSILARYVSQHGTLALGQRSDARDGTNDRSR